MATELFTLVGKIMIEGMDNVQSQLKGIESTVQKNKEGIRALGMAMTAAGAAIVGVLTLSAKKYAELGSQAYLMSEQTGLSTEMVSRLGYAASVTGAGISELNMAVKTSARIMGDAAQGSKTAQDRLKSLGLSIESLMKLKTEDRFLAIAKAVASVTDPTLRLQAAMDLFGKTGQSMLPMLSNGADGLQELMDKADQLGVVFSEESAKKAEEFSHSLEELKTSVDGLRVKIGGLVAEVVKPYIDGLTSMISNNKLFADSGSGVSRVLVSLGIDSGVALTALGALALTLPKIITLFKTLGTSVGIGLGALAGITIGGGLILYGLSQKSQMDKLSRDIDTIVSKEKAQGTITVDDTQKLIALIRQRNELYSQFPLTSNERKAVEANEALAKSLEDQIAPIDEWNRKIGEEHTAAVDQLSNSLETAQREYDDLSKSLTGAGSDYDNLNRKVRDSQYELGVEQIKLSAIKAEFDKASATVKNFQDKISDAKNELMGLESPHFTGQKEFADQIFAIDEQIKKLRLQQLQKQASGFDDTEIQKQIDALENQREQLQLTSEITYDPLTKSAKDAVDATLGLNKEMAPADVMARIRELSAKLAPGGEYNQGLSDAEATLGEINGRMTTEQGIVDDLTSNITSWSVSLEGMKNNIDDILKNKQDWIDFWTVLKNTVVGNPNATSVNVPEGGEKPPESGITIGETTPASTTVPVVNNEPEANTAKKAPLPLWLEALRYLLPVEEIAHALKIPGYATGIDRVPKTQIALVHQGERIIPASRNGMENSRMEIHNHLYIDGVEITDVVERYMDSRYRLQST